MKSILITTLLSTVNAHLSPEPCEVIANPTGSATAFSFSCNVETKQLNGKMKATFSRPFELMAKEGIMLPDTRKDIISGAASPFSYYFNPLGDLPAASAILKDKGCAETHGTDAAAKNTWSAGAYQWDSRLKATGGCTRLTGAAEGGMTKYAYNGWSAYLLDIEDATQGIMIHMSGGDACGPEGARKFNISLMCDTSALAESKPYIEEAVSEDKTCTYEIDLETTHGCPDECKAPFNVFENGKEPGGTLDASKNVCNTKGSCRSLADGKPECACTDGDAYNDESDYVGPGCSFACPNTNGVMCSNQGHCSFEAGLVGKNGRARCFCNTGYEGEECETNTRPIVPGQEPTSSAAPWILLLILSAIFAGAWWYHRKEHDEPFCCCGQNGFGEGFSGEGPPRFSGIENGGGGYVAPSSEQSI